MKNTITISQVIFGNKFTNNQSFTKQGVDLLCLERVPQFEKNEDDEKVYKECRRFRIEMSDFTRILALNPWLSLIKKTTLTEEQQTLSDKEKAEVVYEDHARLLGSSTLEFEREEDRKTVYSDRPVLDEDGNPKKDKNDEIIYEPELDDENHPKTVLCGFKETTFLRLTLSEPALELAKELAKTKK